RRAQQVDHLAAELRQLVEEEHAAVRERELARPRDHAAARHAGERDRAVGGAQRRLARGDARGQAGRRGGARDPARARPLRGGAGGGGGRGGTRAGSPAAEWMHETSSAPASSRSGSRAERLFASMLLPVPGGPVSRTWWPPAAAITSARFAASWPTIASHAT